MGDGDEQARASLQCAMDAARSLWDEATSSEVWQIALRRSDWRRYRNVVLFYHFSMCLVRHDESSD